METVLATWNPERQLWETDQASLFCEQPEPFSETWPTSGMTRSGSLSPLPPSGRRTGGSGSSSSPTPQGSYGTGLLPTPLSGDGTHGSPNQKDSGGNPSLAPAVIALNQMFPTPKATDGVFATPTNPGRPVDRSTFLGTIVAKVVAPLNPGPMLCTPDTMPDAPNSSSNMRSRPAGLTNQVVEAQSEAGLLPTPTAMQAGDTPEAWLRWKNGRRKVGDLKVLVENPELLNTGGVLPDPDEQALLPTPRAAQGETRNSTIYAREGGDRGNLESALANVPSVAAMLPTPAAVDGSGAGSALQSREALEEGRRQAHLTDLPRLLPEADEDRVLFPTPVCTDAFGAARHTTTTGVMHSGTSLTDAIRLLPTPSAVDGHPSSPGRHNSEGHQSTLPGVARELGQEPLLPTPCARQSGCTPEDSIKNKPPGRRQITDLSIMVSNPGLMESGGVPDWLAEPEEPGLF